MLACLLVVPAALAAQTRPWRRALVLEVGGSGVRPPESAVAGTGGFAVLGLRGFAWSRDGSGASLAFLTGLSLDDEDGGDFLSAAGDAALWSGDGAGWAIGLRGSAFAFHVDDPFPYTAGGGEGGPAVRYVDSRLSVTATGIAGGGRSRVKLHRARGGPVRVFEDDLWRVGGEVEALVRIGPVSAGVAGGAHRTAGGTYRSGGGRLLIGAGGPAVEIRSDVWRTPLDTKVTGGVALVVPLGGRWTVRGFTGRADPDPMTLTEPGRGSAGALLGLSLLVSSTPPEPPAPLHEVTARDGNGARVRWRVSPPGDPRSVALAGDFNQWQPVPMVRNGKSWRVDFFVPDGVHHFGFLVDGGWYLPEDVPDAVPDEWGRGSATLVIEGEGPGGAFEEDERPGGGRMP